MGKLKEQLLQITRFLGMEQHRTMDSVMTCWLPDLVFGLSWRGPHNSPAGSDLENLCVYPSVLKNPAQPVGRVWADNRLTLTFCKAAWPVRDEVNLTG